MTSVVFGSKTNNEYYYSDANKIGAGGEGIVYAIENTDLCIKIYHKRIGVYEGKIKYMCDNAPFDSQSNVYDKNIIVWPIETVYDSDSQFKGFVMKRIDESVTLTALNTTNIQPQLLNKYHWLKGYCRTGSEFYKRRVMICHNLASSINLLHKSGKYVIVDCKEDNIKLTPQGKTYIIDLDNIQVYDDVNKRVYNSRVSTEDIIPPEGFKKNFKVSEQRILANWDVFSYSVIIYKILTGGPPFFGTLKQHNSIDHSHPTYNQKNKLFPMGSKKRKFAVIPAYHNAFKDLNPELQKLLLKSFEKSKRPAIFKYLDFFLRENDNINNCTVKIYPSPNYNSPVKNKYFNTKPKSSRNFLKIPLKNLLKARLKPRLKILLTILFFLVLFSVLYPLLRNTSTIYNNQNTITVPLRPSAFSIMITEDNDISRGTFDITEISNNTEGAAIINVYSGSFSNEFRRQKIFFTINDNIITFEKLGKAKYYEKKSEVIIESLDDNNYKFIMKEIKFD
jgi:hypothetical protein